MDTDPVALSLSAGLIPSHRDACPCRHPGLALHALPGSPVGARVAGRSPGRWQLLATACLPRAVEFRLRPKLPTKDDEVLDIPTLQSPFRSEQNVDGAADDWQDRRHSPLTRRRIESIGGTI